MDIIFMGSPAFALPCLQALIASKHNVVAVYTQPPKARGRGNKHNVTPVHKLAEHNNIPVFYPKNFKDKKDVEQFTNLNADVAVVAAYGLLLPLGILQGTKQGCINIHPSSLPRWRGAAPINRTIMAGDTSTEVCIMQMDRGLDTGDVYIRQELTIEANTTAGELHDKCADIGAKLTLKVIDNLLNIQAVPQIGEPIYASKVSKDECKIDWNKPAEEVKNIINGLSPFPGAYFIHNNTRIKPLKCSVINPNIANSKIGEVIDSNFSISCQNGAIAFTLLQREGKKPQQITEFIKGYNLKIGEMLV